MKTKTKYGGCNKAAHESKASRSYQWFSASISSSSALSPSRLHRTLLLLDEIRSTLHSNGFPELDLTFPIGELTTARARNILGDALPMHSKRSAGSNRLRVVTDPQAPVGLTNAEYFDWVLSTGSKTKTSTSFKVLGLFVRLRPMGKEDPKTGEYGTEVEVVDEDVFPLIRILPTFLHELAHCCIQGEQRRLKHSGAEEDSWVFNGHNDAFYDKFASILVVASRLGIYQLPPTLSSATKKDLEKLDNMDILNMNPLDRLGSTILSI